MNRYGFNRARFNQGRSPFVGEPLPIPGMVDLEDAGFAPFVTNVEDAGIAPDRVVIEDSDAGLPTPFATNIEG